MRNDSSLSNLIRTLNAGRYFTFILLLSLLFIFILFYFVLFLHPDYTFYLN